MSRKVAICILLAAVTVWVYWPVSQHAFVAYDDLEYVADNPPVKAGLSWSGVGWAFSHRIVSNWHPVTTLSHMLDCQLFGLAPGAHHLVNVGLHVSNAVLLFLLLSELTGAVWRSAIVGAIFALHPLHVESVAWVAERKDVLSTFFFMLTLLAYTSYAHRKEGTGASRQNRPSSRSWSFYVAAWFLFLLGLLSKPMLVTLPFVLLLLDFWPLRRLKLETPKSNSRLVREKFPFFALSVVFCLVTLVVQKAGGAMEASAKVPFLERVGNAFVSYYTYLVQVFWPANLAVTYPHPALGHPPSSWPIWQVMATGVILAAITLAALSYPQRRPWFTVGWLWFLGTLVPVIGLVQVGTQARADRYMYIPLIGVAISLVWGVAELANTWSASRLRDGPAVIPESPVAHSGVSAGNSITGVLAVLALSVCALVAHNQLQYWHNTTTLFEHNVAVTPDNPAARGLLAVGLEAEGRVDEAIGQYRSVAAVEPKFECHLGQLLYQRDHPAEAAEHFTTAVRAFPDDPVPRLGLAAVLQQMGKDREAAEQLEAALRLDGNSVNALNNLAWLRATAADPTLRNGTQAVELAERACQLTQNRETMLVGTLAAAYAETGHFEQAVTSARRACELASQKGETELLKRNQELLQAYLEHKPFHQSASAEQH